MFTTFRKLFCFKKETKTPLGFCDGPSSGKGSLSCCDCSTEDRYQHPYDPENKFHEAVCQGRTKLVLRLLSKKKFHVNDQDERKRTALHFACFYGHLNLVQLLLQNECNINACDDNRSTPLMKAVQSWETKIVSVLLDNEADPNIKDAKGETALHHAVYVDRPDIATYLIESGGNIEETTKDGFTPLLLALRERKLLMAEHLITHGANIYVHDAYKRTTLMYAVKWDSEAIVELLLKKGIDHTSTDAFGWNALQYAKAGKRKVNYFESESLMSVCSRIEDKASFKTQQDIPEDILKNGADDSPIPSRQYKSIEAQEEEAELEPIQDLNLESENVYKKSEGYQKLETSRKVTHSFNIRNDTEKNQVWAYKCLHPELRDYSHPTSKPESEPQESQPDLSEELKEEIPKSELQNESFDKSAKNQEFGVSDANELQELYTEVPCSSNTNNDAGKNVMRHLENITVMRGQKQTSEGRKQQSGRKIKQRFIDAVRACFCACCTKKHTFSSHHQK